MIILGINAYHANASAAIVVDGQLIAAAEEERFNRVKYAAGLAGAGDSILPRRGWRDAGASGPHRDSAETLGAHGNEVALCAAHAAICDRTRARDGAILRESRKSWQRRSK